MRTVKYVILLLFAVGIDFLQIALGWIAFAVGAGLNLLSPIGGGIGGAVTGAYFCWDNTTGILAAATEATKCALGGGLVGALAGTFGAPIGMALGFAFDIVISLTFGAGLITLLIFFGMYSPGRTFGGLVFEIMPGLDVLPGWTTMVVLSIMKDYANHAEGAIGKVVGIAMAATSVASAKNPLAAARGVSNLRSAVAPSTQNADTRQEAPTRTPLGLKSPSMRSDVAPRAPLRNTSYVQKAA